MILYESKDKEMSTIEEKLRKHAPTTPSKWREKAEWRQQNKEELRHSQQVAMRKLATEEKNKE
jgi:hypothetical protein